MKSKNVKPVYAELSEEEARLLDKLIRSGKFRTKVSVFRYLLRKYWDEILEKKKVGEQP
jgi:Arc/MetJ-type ribon-helix-helix transcriptional regulator